MNVVYHITEPLILLQYFQKIKNKCTTQIQAYQYTVKSCYFKLNGNEKTLQLSKDSRYRGKDT